MRRITAILLCITAAAIVPAACDKTPVNGPLDGFWQLTTIATPDSVRDVRRQGAFLSVYLHLSQWDHGHREPRVYAHFTHTADSIIFYDFAHLSTHQTTADDDQPVTPEEMASGLLDDWGVHTLDARFRVLTLNHSRMELQAADTVLTFRKY